MRSFLFFAETLLLVTSAVAQQLPAGTREADEHPPQASDRRINAAEAALEKHDYAAAATQLTALAAERPKDARVLYDLGFADEALRQESDAAKAYASAIAADATLAEPRVALGLLDARAGRSEKARQELADAAKLIAPPQLRARALRALASIDASSQPDVATEELLEAVKLTGETPADVALSAGLAEKSGETGDAEAAYRRLLQNDPNNADAAASLAHLLSAAKKPAEAEAVLANSMKAHPDDPRLVSQLAAVYASEGKTASAIPLVEKLRVSQPGFDSNDALMRLLANLYSQNGQYADAEKIYRLLAQRDPADASLLDDVGDSLVKQRKFAEAQPALAKAVSLRAGFTHDDDWALAAEHLAYAASRNQDYRTSLQALAARATVLPNSPQSLFLEAIAHDALHEIKEAVKAYKAFLTLANGKFPDQEFQARHRLVALQNTK